MATQAQVNALRELLGETVPEDGTEADTFFPDDARLRDLIDDSGGNLILAVAKGWEIKTAEFANYMTFSTGGNSRRLSELYKQAKEQRDYYYGMSGSTPAGDVSVAGLAPPVIAKLLKYEPGPSGYPSVWPATDTQDTDWVSKRA